MTKLTLVIGNKNYSSWSLRPWLAMKQFGLEFDEIRIPLYTPKSKAQLRQYSPSGKVPVLIHDTLTVWDSLAICEYLAEEFPRLPWWGKDRIVKAIARSLSAEMHSGFGNLRQQMPMNCRARLPGQGLTAEVQQDIDRITTIWREYRQRFETEGNLLFGEFTIADAMFAPVVLRFITYAVPLDPISQHYAETIVALPAMQEWLEAAVSETETISQYK
ncbi:MAG: glutathione S-transferase family protein [Microcystaceae cyanobacterium]